ncbi:hypothetical protein DSECCO2_361490 [anaerobic digester metagenome]
MVLFHVAEPSCSFMLVRVGSTKSGFAPLPACAVTVPPESLIDPSPLPLQIAATYGLVEAVVALTVPPEMVAPSRPEIPALSVLVAVTTPWVMVTVLFNALMPAPFPLLPLPPVAVSVAVDSLPVRVIEPDWLPMPSVLAITVLFPENVTVTALSGRLRPLESEVPLVSMSTLYRSSLLSSLSHAQQ